MSDRHLKAVDQMAIDEKYLDEPALEAALEDLDRVKLERATATAKVKEARAIVDRHSEGLELPDGLVARVGRWRLERVTTPARSVAFDVAPSTRIKISAAD